MPHCSLAPYTFKTTHDERAMRKHNPPSLMLPRLAQAGLGLRNLGLTENPSTLSQLLAGHSSIKSLKAGILNTGPRPRNLGKQTLDPKGQTVKGSLRNGHLCSLLSPGSQQRRLSKMRRLISMKAQGLRALMKDYPIPQTLNP